ncbi:MAG: hypothetical protein ABL933_17870 [Methyloglobulus sp.]|nr:hypothetical protein [Methyloglobulus sp.]
MFNLKKDLETYQGITPYASEHYGVYQPILGWQSKLTKLWLKRSGVLIDPRVKRVLDGRIKPGPDKVELYESSLPHMLEFKPVIPPEYRHPWFVAIPIQPGSLKSPFKVILAKDLNSELLKLLQLGVQAFVDVNNGALPKDNQWDDMLSISSKGTAGEKLANELAFVNGSLWHRLYQELKAQASAQDRRVSEEMIASAEKKLLELMQYESQIARFLLTYAERQGGLDPNELKKLFIVQEAPPMSDILLPNGSLENFEDPLANIDPKSQSGALSPVGFVHLFRQYFFDLGAFNGEPVEHVWLAPGTTIELIEVSTRKTIVERTQESSEEMTNRSEQSTSVKDELSDAVKAENGSSTKLGVSTTQNVNYGVYQGSATASLGAETTRKDARETSHKQNREQAEKLSSEIKRSFKSIFKTVTETTDTRSRRYVLQNNGNDLRNYELRRKMRRVGVQLQDLGTQLCWQVFIDDAGADLGLAELVHFAESPDLANFKEPEPLPPPANISKKVTIPIPFSPILKYDNNGPGVIYEWSYQETIDSAYKGKYLGTRSNSNDDTESDSQIIMGPFNCKFDAPQNNYKLVEIRILGPQGSKLGAVRGKPIPNENMDGSFSCDLVMQQLSFGGEQVVNLDAELIFSPTDKAYTDYQDARKKDLEKYEADKQRLLKKSFMEDVRQRIKDASNIKSRPSWDLREEERTIIYRKLINRLMLDSWGLPDSRENNRLIHARSEVIRAIFDVDAMLYFVAPEWWMPRKHRTPHKYDPLAKVGNIDITLTDNNTVKWDDIELRPDNYKITEDSTPAKLGNSLGWLLQLDGDNLRNAFLNAPWVKAVIPIRPGREKAALNWLKSIEGHEFDGWEAPYLSNNTPEDQAIIDELAAEHKNPTIGNVLEKVAEKLEKNNSDINNVLEADKVFETGFSHLGNKSFDAGLPANQVFSQWITVLPTDQIVAVEYKATELFEP